MLWNQDAFFVKGKTHAICQDYARADRWECDRTDNMPPHAVLCDGCSSSPDTDIGARVLAMLVLHKMEEECFRKTPKFMGDEFKRDLSKSIISIVSKMNISSESMDATLLTMRGRCNDENRGIECTINGDGVIVARARNGGSVVYVYEHTENAPMYLNYELGWDCDRHKKYLEKFGDEYTVRTFCSAENPPQSVLKNKLRTGGNGTPPNMWFGADEFDLVMIFSDGIQSFQKRITTDTSQSFETVSLQEVVEQLLRIKGTKGKFLQRRCHKFLNKFCEENGWQHTDDFSAAAIWMGEPDVIC